jgi:hypothetical protein
MKNINKNLFVDNLVLMMEKSSKNSVFLNFVLFFWGDLLQSIR